MQLLLAIFGWGTAWLLIGYIPLFFLYLWLFIDIFLIPGMCRNPKSNSQSLRKGSGYFLFSAVNDRTAVIDISGF